MIKPYPEPENPIIEELSEMNVQLRIMNNILLDISRALKEMNKLLSSVDF